MENNVDTTTIKNTVKVAERKWVPDYDAEDSWGPVCSECLYYNHPVKPCEVCRKKNNH